MYVSAVTVAEDVCMPWFETSETEVRIARRRMPVIEQMSDLVYPAGGLTFLQETFVWGGSRNCIREWQTVILVHSDEKDEHDAL